MEIESNENVSFYLLMHLDSPAPTFHSGQLSMGYHSHHKLYDLAAEYQAVRTDLVRLCHLALILDYPKPHSDNMDLLGMDLLDMDLLDMDMSRQLDNSDTLESIDFDMGSLVALGQCETNSQYMAHMRSSTFLALAAHTIYIVDSINVVHFQRN